jgi:hypothetical protein
MLSSKGKEVKDAKRYNIMQNVVLQNALYKLKSIKSSIDDNEAVLRAMGRELNCRDLNNMRIL